MHDLLAQPTASSNKLCAGFCWGRKSRIPGEKQAGSRTNTNSAKIWHHLQNLNPGHIGGRWMLSPLCYPCPPFITIAKGSGVNSNGFYLVKNQDFGHPNDFVTCPNKTNEFRTCLAQLIKITCTSLKMIANSPTHLLTLVVLDLLPRVWVVLPVPSVRCHKTMINLLM